MIKVLFVCLGNICRSPMAEYVFKDIVAKEKLNDKFMIASCATSYEESGNPVYPPARKKLLEHNIDCSKKTSRRIEKDDYDKYDFIIAMEQRNINNILCIVEDDPENKISLLLDFAGEHRGIDDPWYTGDFETTYQDIYKGCVGLLNYLKNNDYLGD